MPRVVPSQIVDLIDQFFPQAKDQMDGKLKDFSLDMQTYSSSLSGLLLLIDKIPHELIAVDGEEYSSLFIAIEAIRNGIIIWQTRNLNSAVNKIPGLEKTNPITVIRRVLLNCPDEFPTIGTSELHFIEDPAIKQDLETDLSSAHSAYRNAEWKASTVISGSLLEALLFWTIKKAPEKNIEDAVSSLDSFSSFKGIKGKKIEEWNLHQLIEVSLKSKLISEQTAEQARLAKDFRNLIHPGRALRLEKRCDRATSLSALASVEHVIKDLSPKS